MISCSRVIKSSDSAALHALFSAGQPPFVTMLAGLHNLLSTVFLFFASCAMLAGLVAARPPVDVPPTVCVDDEDDNGFCLADGMRCHDDLDCCNLGGCMRQSKTGPPTCKPNDEGTTRKFVCECLPGFTGLNILPT